MSSTSTAAPVLIYENPSRWVLHWRIAVACTTVATLLDVYSALFARSALHIFGPVTVASLALLASASVRWKKRGDPAIVISPDTLQIRLFAEKAIPWAAVKTAYRFRAFPLGVEKIAIDFNCAARRPIRSAYGQMPEGPIEVSLKTSDYAIDGAVLEQLLLTRIAESRGQPAVPPNSIVIRQRDGAYSVALTAGSASLLAVVVVAGIFTALRDNRLRTQIAAPHYDFRSASSLTSAPQDIRAYPRDPRVRLNYGKFLSEHGRLTEAEAELEGALADQEALALFESRGRLHSDLTEHLWIALAIAFASDGKTGAAKAAMVGLCPFVADADMANFAKLHLCHYE